MNRLMYRWHDFKKWGKCLICGHYGWKLTCQECKNREGVKWPFIALFGGNPVFRVRIGNTRRGDPWKPKIMRAQIGAALCIIVTKLFPCSIEIIYCGRCSLPSLGIKDLGKVSSLTKNSAYKSHYCHSCGHSFYSKEMPIKLSIWKRAERAREEERPASAYRLGLSCENK